MVRILLVEDDLSLAELLRDNLQDESYSVDTVATGEEGENLVETIPYDLMILDVALPGKDGLEVCRNLRQKNKPLPILLLSGRCTQEDKVLGFDSGADDYMTKPFAFRELFARIKVLLRRQPALLYTQLKVGKYTLDLIGRRFLYGEKMIELTRKECLVMEYFMNNPGQVLTRIEIEQHIGDPGKPDSVANLEAQIKSIRAKMEESEKESVIQPVKGGGFLFKACQNSQ